jgi:glucose-6-phosphate-specific signal transduction histidine kinase
MPPVEGQAPPGNPSAAIRDLLVVAAVTGLAFVLSSVLELREWLTEVTHPLEHYQMDELPLTFAVLALALAWFAWRRWRHAEQELRLRVQAQRELSDALAENRLLSQKYLMLQEEERRNLAREMHDELGQCLNAIKLDAVSMRDMAQGRHPEVETAANSIIDLSGHVYDVVRGIMQRLRPAALDALGLHDAVGHLVGQWRRRHPDVDCRFEAGGDLADLGEVVNITVYRLVQECLTNIAKHAHAGAVTVSLQRTSPGEIRISVRDDGRGMDLNAKRSGLGLVGLRERVEALNGHLWLRSAPGQGLEVVASLPVPLRQGDPASARMPAQRSDAEEPAAAESAANGGRAG